MTPFDLAPVDWSSNNSFHGTGLLRGTERKSTQRGSLEMSMHPGFGAILSEVVREQSVVSNSPTLMRLFPTSTASHEVSDSVVNDVLACLLNVAV